jgi:hypothetical protein
MVLETPRRRPRVRWPFLVALGLALCGLGVRYTVLAQGATGPSIPPVRTLSGVTGQGTTIELGIQDGRVHSLITSLNARCAGGSSWRENWSPTEGNPVHFTMTGRTFVTEQHAYTTYPSGITGAIGFAIRGTLTGAGGAQGTIRLVARFYRGGSQWNACDSLDVPWAVGPHARAHLSTVPLGSQISQYFAALPSLATNVSPARRRFIGRVDGACVATYGWLQQALAVVEARYRYWSAAKLIQAAAYAELHAWQLRAIESLGQPPQARGLYDAWLANFRRRVRVEGEAVRLYTRGRFTAFKRAVASVGPLKAHGDLLGQKFGLVRCTSNVGTEVPILDDGQPLPLP